MGFKLLKIILEKRIVFLAAIAFLSNFAYAEKFINIQSTSEPQVSFADTFNYIVRNIDTSSGYWLRVENGYMCFGMKGEDSGHDPFEYKECAAATTLNLASIQISRDIYENYEFKASENGGIGYKGTESINFNIKISCITRGCVSLKYSRDVNSYKRNEFFSTNDIDKINELHLLVNWNDKNTEKTAKALKHLLSLLGAKNTKDPFE